jgi:cytochrome c-type biogenesis protein CcmH/NrfG
MSEDLRSLEAMAFNAQRQGNYETAISFWLRLLKTVENWEDGNAHYNLADCYERVGKFDDAEMHYAAAIRIAPSNTLFSTALSSLISDREAGLVSPRATT